MQLLKGGYKLAETLAKEFMKAGSKADKLKVIQKAKDSKVNKQFSEIKSGMMKKEQTKPKNIIPSRKTMEVRERAAWDAKEKSKVDRAAKKKKKLESVGAFNRAREERKTAGTSYGMKKGGKVSPPARPGKTVRSKTGRGKTKPQKAMPSPGLMGLAGKVYKVDNSGQDLVQRMYGGKIKK